MCMELHRYHGLGNDYLVYDPQTNRLPLNEKRIRLICHRNFGFGSDGILFGPVLDNGKITVRIFNPDGSEAEKSGNGVRIFSQYLKDAGYVKNSGVTLTTAGGDVDVEYLDDSGSRVRAYMGKASFDSGKIPVAGPERQVIDEPMVFGDRSYRVTCLTVGNPHCVIPMPDISKEAACALGPFVENAACFPNRINMQLLKVIDRKNIRIEIYERGAGYTLASGSSSCAAAGAAHRLGLVEPDVTVHMPGGKLQIGIRPDGGVDMTGDTESIGVLMPSGAFLARLEALTA
ncbi:MAG: diaminopimelate epimerase [Eubacteriales bacterium]|nr:diaminopimelate epimerase [Eubacteriales bacterium]